MIGIDMPFPNQCEYECPCYDHELMECQAFTEYRELFDSSKGIDELHDNYRPEWCPLKEIVQCKDCKHGSLYCTEDVCGETLIECNRPDLGDVEIHGWKWFCADGERRHL